MISGSAVFIVVNRGQANGLLHRAQQIGAQRGTIFSGEGTSPSRLLDILGINKTNKEVLLIAVPKAIDERLYGMLREEFQLHKRNKGIAFSVPFRQYNPEDMSQTPAVREYSAPYICLVTVLEKGLGSECMKFARTAGAVGGTVASAHGAGVAQDFYFPLVIEPQKDIVMIVTPRENAPQIRETICTNMQLERKGAGVLFVLPVTRTLGLYEERQQERLVSP
jgi:nitrogen regulatory protein PII/transposase-like protein